MPSLSASGDVDPIKGHPEITNMDALEPNERKPALPQHLVSRMIKIVEAASLRTGLSPDEVISSLEHISYGDEEPITSAAVARFTARLGRIVGRRDALPGVTPFCTPMWAMLLELFLANHEGRKLTVTGLCEASGAPWTTALRHIERLEALGLINRKADLEDRRRIWVSSDSRTLDHVGKVMTEIQSAARKE